jgi:hypothetical protein
VKIAMKLAAIDIPCNFCGAEAGEPCQEVCHAGVFGAAPVAPTHYHAQRIQDVIYAEDAANKLIGDQQ